VEAVSAGTSIKVCPGTYAEQVVIDKGVKISAPGGEGTATVKLPATIATASGPCATSPEEETEIVLCTSESVNLTNLSIDAGSPEEPAAPAFAGSSSVAARRWSRSTTRSSARAPAR
jgi:hypothetical protein